MGEGEGENIVIFLTLISTSHVEQLCSSLSQTNYSMIVAIVHLRSLFTVICCEVQTFISEFASLFVNKADKGDICDKTHVDFHKTFVWDFLGLYNISFKILVQTN